VYLTSTTESGDNLAVLPASRTTDEKPDRLFEHPLSLPVVKNWPLYQLGRGDHRASGGMQPSRDSGNRRARDSAPLFAAA
jgi:hypothetical protein